jgi:hypothetical protein
VKTTLATHTDLGMKEFSGHKDLDGWKKSTAIGLDVYQAVQKFPPRELCGLTS